MSPRNDLIQERGGTAAAWTSANPVLALREPGIETDTGKVKYGNGIDVWADLSYADGGGGLGTQYGLQAAAGQQITYPGFSTIVTWDTDTGPSVYPETLPRSSLTIPHGIYAVAFEVDITAPLDCARIFSVALIGGNNNVSLGPLFVPDTFAATIVLQGSGVMVVQAPTGLNVYAPPADPADIATAQPLDISYAGLWLAKIGDAA